MKNRLEALASLARRRQLDCILICHPANIRAFTGICCDHAVMRVDASGQVLFWTDFRYLPMVHRVARTLKAADLRHFGTKAQARGVRRIGYESSLSHAQFLAWQKKFPRAAFVDLAGGLSAIRAVKTPDEIAALRAAERLTCRIWQQASARFAPGMTEREMARIIQTLMIEKGDGEAFDTIVCVGANAAECHHVPDETVWDGRAPVLADLGVKLKGVCADLTRNVVPVRPRPLYRQVYNLVHEANRAAIAAARPGITGQQLDRVARDVIRKGGFGRCFGHALGHGVGYEIHEAPTVSKREKMILKPGMVVTIEPGIYLEGNLGVRIEDLILITETGCEVLSSD